MTNRSSAESPAVASSAVPASSAAHRPSGLAEPSHPGRLTLALVVPAPVLLALGTALDPAGGPPVDAYLARTEAAPGGYLASGMLLMAGMLLLVPAAIGAWRVGAGRGFGVERGEGVGARAGVRGTRGSRLLRTGAVLLGAWGCLASIGVALGYTAGWAAIGLSDAAPALRVEVFEAITYSPFAMVAAPLGGAAWVGATAVIGLALVLGRAGRRWGGALVLLSLVFEVVGGPVLRMPLLAGAGFLLFGVGLAALAWRWRG